MKRKILWLGLSFLLVAALVLASCAEAVPGEQEEEEEEPITITWWLEAMLPEEVEALERIIIQPYEEIYPHINIEASVQPELFEVLRLALPAGEGPDIVLTMGPAEAALYAAEGLLAPLDEYIVEAGLDKLIAPLALNLGTVKGKIYSIPKTFESMGIIYNRSLFDKHGWEPATNRQEFVALQEAILAKGILPIVAGNVEWRATNEWFVTVYLNHYAGPENVYKALTGQLAWDAPIFVEAIEMLRQDFLRYWTDLAEYPVLTFPDVMIQLATGEAAMTVVGSWGFSWVTDPAYWPTDDQWGWAPFPSLRQGVDYPSVAIGVGTTISVSSLSPHIDEAARFIVWFLAYKEGVANLLLELPGDWIVPIEVPEELIPSGVDPVFIEHIQTQNDLIDKGAYGYTTWTWLAPEAWLWVYEEIEKVWLGSLTVEEYMKTWNEIFQREFAAGLIPPVAARD